MRKPTLLLAAVGTTLLTGAVQAENSISWQGYQYSENDDRIDVRGGAIAVKQDFGTDYELSAGIDYDTVTGATPMWVPVEGYSDQFEKGQIELEPESRDGSYASLLMRDASRNEYTVSANYSTEPDFLARGIALNGLFWADESHNRSFIVGGSRMFNRAIASDYTNHSEDEDSTADYLQAGINQVINSTTTLELSGFYGAENGYQSNQYLKIVRVDAFNNRALAPEERPEDRESAGMAARVIHSWSPGIVTHLWYRYYQDDWDIEGHTLEAKLYWDLTPQWRLNPVVRAGTQSAASFYKNYDDAINYFAATGYGSNDERLGEFDTHTLQFNVEYRASKEWSLNAGISDYSQDNGFDARWLTAGFVFRH